MSGGTEKWRRITIYSSKQKTKSSSAALSSTLRKIIDSRVDSELFLPDLGGGWCVSQCALVYHAESADFSSSSAYDTCQPPPSQSSSSSSCFPPVELVVLRLLSPHDTLQTLLGQRMDDSAVRVIIALDLTLHPHDQAGVHPNVVVLGALDLVGELEFRGGAADMGLGEGDDAAAAAASGNPRGR